MYLGLGANIGRPGPQILAALAALSRELGPLRAAPLYRTRPVSDIPQPDFLNTVIEVVTERSARDLLQLAKTLEARAGRRPGPRWGPRPLDVDLLVLGDETIVEPDLRVPHPEIAHRAFVLRPLADLAPTLRLPGDEETVSDLLSRLPGDPGIRRVAWSAVLVSPR